MMQRILQELKYLAVWGLTEMSAVPIWPVYDGGAFPPSFTAGKAMSMKKNGNTAKSEAEWLAESIVHFRGHPEEKKLLTAVLLKVMTPWLEARARVDNDNDIPLDEKMASADRFPPPGEVITTGDAKADAASVKSFLERTQPYVN
jgi:hypothetical protein